MSLEKLNKALKTGENICTEFKRCGGKIEEDTYQTVCSFLNRFGGDIYLGVTDNGTIVGVPEKAADGLVKNFISVISNPASLNPTVYISPETIIVDGKKKPGFTARTRHPAKKGIFWRRLCSSVRTM
ncbi:MAG: ATP-binding protein [Ruminococcus sp.]|jgi:ATP-dependent DNA helicase RecG|nr:ATP-binding protein [Ruminococcus sp.]